MQYWPGSPRTQQMTTIVSLNCFRPTSWLCWEGSDALAAASAWLPVQLARLTTIPCMTPSCVDSASRHIVSDANVTHASSIYHFIRLSLQGGAKNANILETPWPNCVEIGELLQYYMLNTVINFLFKNLIALWRHLAKTQLLSDAICTVWIAVFSLGGATARWNF